MSAYSRICGLFILSVAVFYVPMLKASEPPPTLKLDCASLSNLPLPGVDWKIANTQAVAAGPFGESGKGSALPLPAHCVLQAEIDPRTGVAGRHYGIGFELRLPSAWNGKFYFQGGGGMDGLVRPAIGVMPNGASRAAVALARGYAVASTDAGHEGQDGSFGADQQARIDYYYRAIEQVTLVSRRVITAYYGDAPKRSYFLGCSNGGRQGMLAAQRFPLLFDGVVAGDPAFDLTRAAIAEVWEDAAYLRIAPKNGAGEPVLSRAFSDADLKLVAESVLASCDALDGIKDGSIDNPNACHYDPAVLACADAKNDQCLTKDQVAALQAAFGGPKTSDGHALYSDWPYDTGIAAPGWRQWKLGTAEGGASNALNMTLGLEATKSIHMDVYHAAFDWNQYDYNHAIEASKSTSALEDATYTAMTSFHGHGGKLILFTGMSDPIFSASDLIRYYGRLQQDNDGARNTRDWARLFLVPGMTHCSGGPALDDFDPLAALEAWVEQSEAPDAIKAAGKAFPGRARAICAYPAYPHYRGTGSMDDAASFICK